MDERGCAVAERKKYHQQHGECVLPLAGDLYRFGECRHGTFYSDAVRVPQPTRGLALAFTDVEYTNVGAVLTADISGVTDANDDGATDGRGGFVSYTWSRRANNSAAFVAMTSAADATLYTITRADFDDVADRQRPVFQLVASYEDALDYVENLTVRAVVNLVLQSLNLDLRIKQPGKSRRRGGIYRHRRR